MAAGGFVPRIHYVWYLYNLSIRVQNLNLFSRLTKIRSKSNSNTTKSENPDSDEIENEIFEFENSKNYYCCTCNCLTKFSDKLTNIKNGFSIDILLCFAYLGKKIAKVQNLYWMKVEISNVR